MWFCGKDGFLSIVKKDCAEDELLVRSRVQEHITHYFPDAKVERTPGFNRDYLFRARIKRQDVADRIAKYVAEEITQGNFKASVTDKKLHMAYMSVWSAMSRIQDIPPYSEG